MTTAPVARALARAAASRDAARLIAHPDAARYEWRIDYDGDIFITVGLKARSAHHSPEQFDSYVVALNCDSYDVWPPETRFVNPQTKSYVIGRDVTSLPVITGVYGFQLHPVFNNFAQAGRTDQLVCFSFTRGYYDSNHSPAPHERWQQGRHWLFSTVQYLYRALQPPHYQGRMSP